MTRPTAVSAVYEIKKNEIREQRRLQLVPIICRVIAFVIVGVTLPPVQANMLSKTDADNVTNFKNRASMLLSEMHRFNKMTIEQTRSPRNPVIQACRENLMLATVMIEVPLTWEVVAVHLASVMIDPFDEAHALNSSKIGAELILKAITRSKNLVTEMMATCSYDNYVVSEGQEIIRFINELSDNAESLNRRIPDSDSLIRSLERR